MTVQRIARPRESPGACSAWMPALTAESSLPAGQELAGTQLWPLHSYLELTAVPAAVPAARRHTTNVLEEWHLQALADTAELLVSELVTNAICASARVTGQQDQTGQQTGTLPIRLSLTSDRHAVTIQVWDPDPHQPETQDAGLDAETGRGLLLIEALSAQWGCRAADGRDGKIVWAMCAPQDPSAVSCWERSRACGM